MDAYDTPIGTLSPFLYCILSLQFKPVLLKQDQDKAENQKSGKRNARTRTDTNPDPVGTVEPSTSASS